MYRGKSVLCTICARGNSKGVPGKNIRMIGGKPLIHHTIELAKQLGIFEHVVVSTDSDEIMASARKAGAEVFFKRPEHMSTDKAGKLEAIVHAFESSEQYYNERFDLAVDLDATSPLRIADDILKCLDLVIDEGKKTVITAAPSRRSPYFNLIEQDGNGVWSTSKKTQEAVLRRQDAPKCYDMNASVYVWTRDTLLSGLPLFHEQTGVHVMPEERSIDIDSELDFKIVEMIMANR